MIKGHDLMIFEGVPAKAIAAAKSCSINARADVMESSSPASGTARTFVPGRTSWEVAVSTLVLSIAGIILDDDMEPVQYLYDNRTPERALATRMYNHYQTSKKLITAQLESNGAMLSPLDLHIPGSGDGMVCLAESVNWRDDQITAYLFEI